MGNKLVTADNKQNLTLLFLALLGWFGLYFDTISSMVNIWWRSDTFAHGFLIFPISIYLIWHKRQIFLDSYKHSNLWFFIILLGLSLLWMLAAVVDVQVIKQLTIILMLPVIVGALFGSKILKAYSFPLFYLIFAVPFGEFLIPQLQQITAVITVLGLELTGIPVFIEAMYISIPSGDFEVAVACSGIRYLIASLALGILYAHLTYQKLYKRLIFIALAFIVPIIANGIRAYGIIMLAHLSDMKYATGVDHLIYGWLFFGIIIFLLFFVGSYWRDEEPVYISKNVQHEEKITQENTSVQPHKVFLSTYITLIMLIVLLASGPITNFIINYQDQQPLKNFSLNEENIGNWQLSRKQQSNWAPHFIGNDNEIKRDYKQDQKIISSYFAYYQRQTQNKELINQGNKAYHLKGNKLIARHQRQIMIDQQKININVYQLVNQGQQRIVIGWYYVFDQAMINPVKIKIVQAIGKITGLAREGYYIAYAIDYSQDEEKAENDLLEFITQHWPQMRQDLQ